MRCDCFVTEATFGLPIYRWPRHADVFDDMNRWWQANAAAGEASLVGAYSLGKTQHVLAGIEAGASGRSTCIRPPRRSTRRTSPRASRCRRRGPGASWRTRASLRGALVVAPPSAQAPWRWQRAVRVRESFASGWMQQHGARHRAGLDRGFVLSDHADWPGLLAAVDATGCTRVIVTHGDEAVLVRALEREGPASAAHSARRSARTRRADWARGSTMRPRAYLPRERAFVPRRRECGRIADKI